MIVDILNFKHKISKNIWKTFRKNICISLNGSSNSTKYLPTAKTLNVWRRLSCSKIFTPNKNASWKSSPNNYSKIENEMYFIKPHFIKSCKATLECLSWSGIFHLLLQEWAGFRLFGFNIVRTGPINLRSYETWLLN